MRVRESKRNVKVSVYEKKREKERDRGEKKGEGGRTKMHS